MISRTSTGTIQSLGANESKIVRVFPVFGFGDVTVTVVVARPGQNNIRMVKDGFVIGPLVFITS